MTVPILQFQAHNAAGWHLKLGYIVKEACLLIRCLAMDVIFMRALARTGVCLLIRCLRICMHVTAHYKTRVTEQRLVAVVNAIN
jgi:hypothetical protein